MSVCLGVAILIVQYMKQRHGSLLSDYKLSIKQIIKAIYLWSCGRLYTETKQEYIMSAPVFVRLKKVLIKKIQIYWNKNCWITYYITCDVLLYQMKVHWWNRFFKHLIWWCERKTKHLYLCLLTNFWQWILI